MEHFITTEQYQELKKTWKALSDTKAVLSHDILIYNILRGLPADRGFTLKATNIQGNNPWWAFECAKAQARYKIVKTIYESGKGYREVDTGWFKDRFGIELPTELLTKIKEAQHG